MERLTIGIADGLFESSQDSPSNAMPQCSTALCRPYGFPRLNQVQRPNDISQSLKDSSDESTSNLPEANEPSTSLIAGETFDVNMGGTPLPPNPFHRPFIAGVALRMDAFRLVDLADISTGPRLRGVVDEFIPVMVDSMSTHDIIQPPVVRPDPMKPGKFLLVAGLQRVNAVLAGGTNKILCRVVELSDVEAELWEIDENLVRSPLTPAQEALCIDRRRQLHEQLHGKSKARGAIAANIVMGRVHVSATLADASSFVDITAKRTGKSARSVQRVVQRAIQNGRDNLMRVVGTSLDQGNELDALPSLPPAVREALIEQAAAGHEVSAIRASGKAPKSPVEEESSSDGVMSDKQSLGSLTSPRPDDERVECHDGFPGLAALQVAWREASAPARERFLEWINETRATPESPELGSSEALTRGATNEL